jgi:hypothetical protein
MPTPAQVYQEFNKNELSSRQMFELLYNSYVKQQKDYADVIAKNAQLISQLSQLTTPKKKPVIKGKN